jgi:hypothetical protein
MRRVLYRWVAKRVWRKGGNAAYLGLWLLPENDTTIGFLGRLRSILQVGKVKKRRRRHPRPVVELDRERNEVRRP